VTESTRIEPGQWLKDQFARATGPTDLLRFPTDGYESLAPKEKDRLRQTEIEAGEVVRVLGHVGAFTLAMKFDRTVGWLEKARLEVDSKLRGFPRFSDPLKSAAEFFSSWKGIPYVWGGASRRGIDCSGFTQRYFLEVHGLMIPKNSRDQRKAGHPKAEGEELGDNDLIFCHPRSKGQTHHVAVFHEGFVWHARLEHGVVRQTWDEFTAIFEVEELVTVIPK
jgi:probable lipoprotein NlpC